MLWHTGMAVWLTDTRNSSENLLVFKSRQWATNIKVQWDNAKSQEIGPSSWFLASCSPLQAEVAMYICMHVSTYIT